ncbi:uncharacterized protein PFL1_06420 [Pseudozyma flocculosa PF-1]|uniref:1-phosphatidylinositol-4-phosphate 5-kinase n=1 Tax=Pseudozyma flocculosa PF-1 TaxID=1277687 RepID=A0A061H1H7_9BASI|nr:uncharacterized protein PFL1_06420 [Pseudozyma flocculosa PF-1]EPQ25964.1 hypothetical protein PFL1_06420 [Pseudozyma flocculosa PF-1]
MLMHASDAETLNSIRLALGREEQQIRVNDSTSRETYDLTLSRSAPYASPLVSRTGTPPNANVPGHQSSGSTGHRILRLPQLVSKRGYGQSAAASSLVTAAPVANDDEPVANEKSAAVEPPSLTQQNSFTAPPRHHPMVGELPPSPPLEADYITGNKQPGLASSAFQAVRGSADQNGHPHDSASPAGHMVPPKVPVPRRAYTTNFGDFGGVGGGQNGNDGAPAHQPARAAAASGDSEGALAEKEATGLSALTRSRTGREARQRGDDHAHHHHNNDEPKVLVGNLIGEDHANYVLMYNMLTGIRIGVSRCQAKSKRALTDADYAAKHKFTFDIIGNELTPSAKYDFKFKDYAPWVFRELREYFHLDPADYLLSLTSKYILSELGSPGKSGSFFYFSRDYRFIIKTISHGEHKFLRRILRDYHEHIKANPHTLLSRFYGLHRVKLPHGRKIHFVIMNNLFPPHRDIHETYDLKGSSIGRDYPEEKVATKKGAVMKDLNWLRRNREIQLGPEKRALFEAQLKSDVALLQRLRIMDYSLLIGLHDMRRGNKENIRQDALRVFQPETKELRRQPTQVKRGPGGGEKDALALREAVRRSDPKALGAQQVTKLPDRDSSERRYFVFYQDEGGLRATDQDNNPTDMIYYLGVIDLFTPYTTFKRGEHFWKGLSQNKHMISAVPPKEYGQRFIDFLCSVITGGDKSRRPKMYGYTD